MNGKDSNSKASHFPKNAPCKKDTFTSIKPYKSSFAPTSRGVSNTQAIKLLKEFSNLK